MHGRGDPHLRREAVQVLLAQLPDGDRPAALDLLITTLRARNYADASLAGLALSYIPAEGHPAVLAQLLGDDPDMSGLCTLAPYLPEPLLTRAVESACADMSTESRARAFEDLAPHLSSELLRHALDLVLELDTPTQRADALVRLAPRLPETELLAVLAEVGDVDEPDNRALLLPVLAEHLPTKAMSTALELLPDDANPIYRAATLIVVADRLSGAERDSLTTRALAAAKEVPFGLPELHDLLDGVTEVHRIWPVMALQAALDSGRRGRDPLGLAGLAHRVPRSSVDRAVPIARAIEDSCQRAHALATLVLCTSGSLQTTLLVEALHAACAEHHHPDGTFCLIEKRLAEVVTRVPSTKRLPLADEFVAGLRAEEDREPDPNDPDRRARQLSCLASYEAKRRAVPTTVAASPAPLPHDWAHWRSAFADVAATSRNALRSAAVDACLAMAEPSSAVDPTATRLARHLMAVNRWWPGSTRTRPTAHPVREMVAHVIDMNTGSERERWMSEDF